MAARHQKIGSGLRQRNVRIGNRGHVVLRHSGPHVDGDIDPTLIVSDGIDITRRETCFFRVVSTRVLLREPQTMPMVWGGNKGTTTDFKSSPDLTTLEKDTVRDHFDGGRFLSAIKGVEINQWREQMHPKSGIRRNKAPPPEHHTRRTSVHGEGANQLNRA